MKNQYDIQAYQQRIRHKIERTIEPRHSVKPNGRFYVPMTNMYKELWNFVCYKKKRLTGVDVKSSHVYCLLALLKDIAINYFEGEGSHEESLSKCQFSKQIKMIPGLVEHLRRAKSIYQAKGYFQFNKDIPVDPNARRKLMCKIFTKFTKSLVLAIKKYSSIYKNSDPICTALNQSNFIEFLKQYTSIVTFQRTSNQSIKLDNANNSQILDINLTTNFTLHNNNIYSNMTQNTPSILMNHNQELPLVSSLHALDSTVGLETQIELYQRIMKTLLVTCPRLGGQSFPQDTDTRKGQYNAAQIIQNQRLFERIP